MRAAHITDTALHEAGHAVAAIRLGLECGDATIVRKENIWGSVDTDGFDAAWSRNDAESQVLCGCAGFAALVALGRGLHRAARGCSGDFHEAQRLIEFWGLPGTLADWKNRAVELMRRPENVHAVALVAQHLIELRTLDRDYIEVLIGVADGETTHAEFEEYIALRERCD